MRAAPRMPIRRGAIGPSCPGRWPCQAKYDIGQAWDTSHRSWNYGRNDGFVTASSTDSMAYWTEADVPFYCDLARTFPLCDRYFASVMAQTYPNRRFLLAA